MDLELVTSLAEIYRDEESYWRLAMHYDAIQNIELRDKYIDLALQQQDTDDETHIFLRAMQGRADLIPLDVIKRERERLADNPLQLARLHKHLGEYGEAAAAYVRGVVDRLSTGNTFAAAFYLKELYKDGLVEELFKLALKDAIQRKDIYWQSRALEELGWRSELRELLLKHASEIRESDDLFLQEKLAWAEDDSRAYVDLHKEIARRYSDG
ncbi:hypothetical protein HC031_14045 [Planosporangium thailandense]|uniref:Uncharacterized protein n=1 Tax=Planosporangium thailandense TaxID=765197 RepID=A0ABX0XXQ9_9ACTN|nr:hypothetical protein [Planosporangium thailandense]